MDRSRAEHNDEQPQKALGMDEVDDGVWHIFFNTVRIATLDERNSIIKE